VTATGAPLAEALVWFTGHEIEKPEGGVGVVGGWPEVGDVGDEHAAMRSAGASTTWAAHGRRDGEHGRRMINRKLYYARFSRLETCSSRAQSARDRPLQRTGCAGR
jgi:hypothetical protein